MIIIGRLSQRVIHIPEDIVREILKARIALSSSSDADQWELVQLFTTCWTFCHILPALVYRCLKLRTPRQASLAQKMWNTPNKLTPPFTHTLVHMEFLFPAHEQASKPIMAVRHFIDPVTDFVGSYLPRNVEILVFRMLYDGKPMDLSRLAGLLDNAPWLDPGWPKFFAQIPHITTFTVQTAQYMIWPPIQRLESSFVQYWLSNAGSSLTTVELTYGNRSLGLFLQLAHRVLSPGFVLDPDDEYLPPFVWSRFLHHGHEWCRDVGCLPSMAFGSPHLDTFYGFFDLVQ
ncbi:hypothetical protein F5051DRAFT_447322 [Lentinula edodes]|nr:hypothetical protein F5051DRAFT_447322 [Lentinula edodes]KAJ3914338.1 hypothetical protein F5877DRAFT_70797 [Lentinula edodes]